MNKEMTLQLVRNHEGVRDKVYLDTEGIMTIGVGFNLERSGASEQVALCGADYQQLCDGVAALTPMQVDALFDYDLDQSTADARRLVRNFDNHPDEVQAVIVDMVFNLGAGGFGKFKKTIACFEAEDYCGAAAEMTASRWAAQVPNRANEDIALVRKFCIEA